MLVFVDLESDRQSVILDIYNNGPDCAKFLSRRLSMELGAVMSMLKALEKEGWLVRVKGTFLEKRVFRRPKHMNHTYYDLSREAKLLVRRGMR